LSVDQPDPVARTDDAAHKRTQIAEPGQASKLPSQGPPSTQKENDGGAINADLATGLQSGRHDREPGPTAPPGELTAVVSGDGTSAGPVFPSMEPAGNQPTPVAEPAPQTSLRSVSAISEARPAPTIDRVDATLPARDNSHETQSIAPSATTTVVTVIEPPRVAVSLTDVAARLPTSGIEGSENVTPRPALLGPKEREQAEKLVGRGERELGYGNIALARQFFLHAAKAGLARGALLLGSTYDARELAQLSVIGVQPNVALAREWYQRARDLGATEVDERLAGLGKP
jgi:hypothetical protein